MTDLHATGPAPARARPRADRITWFLLAAVLGGAALRFGGVLWGLPLQLHADEWVVVEGAIDMARRNSFEPALFMRPDHLEMQLSYVLYQAWSHVIAGVPPEVAFAAGQAPFYALARVVTAALGTLMIPLAFFIGREFSRDIGLFMAIAVAVFPPFVEHSRYATPDVPLACAVLIVILGAIRYVRTQSWVDLALATFGVSLGVTAKYPAAIAAVAVVYAIIYSAIRGRSPWRILSRGAGALGMFLAMTFALSPVLFTNNAEVRRQLFQQNSTGHLGADGLGWGGNLAFYATEFVIAGGVVFALFALAGLVGIVRARAWNALPLLVGVFFWIGISALTLHWDRWGLPMYVTPVLLAGYGVAAAVRTARGLPSRAAGPSTIVVVCLASLSGLNLLLASVVGLSGALAPDTRAVSGRALSAQGVTADDVYFDGYTSFLTDGPRSVLTDLEVEGGTVTPRDGAATRPYVLTSSSMAGRYLREPGTEGAELYTAIETTLEPVQTWTPVADSAPSAWEPVNLVRSVSQLVRLADGGMTGPEIVLYQLPPS